MDKIDIKRIPPWSKNTGINSNIKKNNLNNKIKELDLKNRSHNCIDCCGYTFKSEIWINL